MEIRKAALNDGQAFWQLLKRLDQETEFMLYEPDERVEDPEKIDTILKQSINGENLLLVAEDDGALVGYLSAQREHLSRIHHVAYVVIGIRADYQHQGIGSRLFDLLDEWARECGIRRLELTVMCENINAQKLYIKKGFQREGIKQDAICKDGRYYNEYYMGKLLI